MRTADLWLRDLVAEAGGAGPGADEGGRWLLLRDDGVDLGLAVADEGRTILLDSLLIGTTRFLPDAFLRRCVAGNFLWIETGGGTLRADPGERGLWLERRLSVDATSFQEFRTVVDAFATTAAALKRRCAEAAAGGEPATAPAAPAEPLLIIRG